MMDNDADRTAIRARALGLCVGFGAARLYPFDDTIAHVVIDALDAWYAGVPYDRAPLQVDFPNLSPRGQDASHLFDAIGFAPDNDDHAEAVLDVFVEEAEATFYSCCRARAASSIVADDPIAVRAINIAMN